jgi:tRNA pseudouridine38-40 synthase
MVRRIAVKLAYDGRNFMGSQRQPSGPTVEGESLRALIEIGAVEDARSSRFASASRTDRGVSALGNVIAFNTGFRGDLLRAFNAATDSVHAYSLAEVEDDFSPRRAEQRWYRYFLPNRGFDLTRVEACAKLFEGRHDFARFCRSEGRTTVRAIDSIDLLTVGDFVVIDVRARDFLWNMIRRMVAAMSEVGLGRAELSVVSKALEGEPISFGLAPSDHLWLMDVAYDIEFQPECPPTLRRKIEEGRGRAFVAMAFFDALSDRAEGSEDERIR